MKKAMIIVIASVLTVSAMANEEVVIPLGQVDLLALHDVAKSNDFIRATSGVGVFGRVCGYVKDGFMFMVDSTKAAIVDHPYIAATTAAGVILADRNNNWTGIWPKSNGATGGGQSGGSSSQVDNSVKVDVSRNNGSQITVVIQSPTSKE